MKEESLLLLSDLQKLINQVVLIDYTIIILGGDIMITMNLKDLPEELTEEEKKMLERAEKASITFDEDCPELTEEQLKQFRRVSERRKSENRKETVTLRLSAKSLRKAKSLGKGYTAVLSRILEDALNDNEVIFKHM